MRTIPIDTFKAVYTNADPEDIQKEFFTKLQNLTPKIPGVLTKTFDYGDRFDLEIIDPIIATNWDDSQIWADGKYWIDSVFVPAITKLANESVTNIAVYTHRELICPKGSGIDFVFIAYIVNKINYKVTLKFWNGECWRDISYLILNTFGTYYHKRNNPNPIFQANERIRLLPGNIGLPNNTNEAKGIWIGYIDTDFFDDLYTAGNSEEVTATTKDYEKGFFAYNSTPEAPDVSEITVKEVVGGSSVKDAEIYYKFSDVYDGIQESLLSNKFRHKFTDSNLYLIIKFTITKATHNKRITSRKVYRCPTIDGSYKHIATIDFLRKTSELTDPNLHGSDGHLGLRTMYIPGATGFSFDPAKLYRIGIYGATKLREVDNFATALSGTGNTIFRLKVKDKNNDLQGDLADYYWDVNWKIQEWNGADWVDSTGTGHNGTNGCYTGYTAFITKTSELISNSYADNILIFFGKSSGIGGTIEETNIIDTNNEHAVKVKNVGLAYDFETGGEWWILEGANVYYSHEVAGVVNYTLYDKALIDQEAHPYQDEVSIKVNGKFAVVCKDILFQLNVVLDPGGKNEIHEDWLTYSELSQYDVNPVSNAFYLIDKEGGAGTGLGTSFNSIIAMKPKAVFKLSLPDPSDPNSWILTEAKFQRGNIAPNGYVQVGDSIYICSIDGIYRIDANIVAASDDTPLLQNKISEPINDIYQGLDNIADKPNIRGIYDHLGTEIIWQFREGYVWAYNIVENTWREIDTDLVFDALTLDENANPIIYDDDNKKIYSTLIPDNAGWLLRTKWFRTSFEHKEVMREMTISYKSTNILTVNLYVDRDDTTIVKTKTLPASTTQTRKRVCFEYWCETYMIEIVDSTQDTNESQIYKIILEDEGEK